MNKTVIYAPSAPEPIGPYSQAIEIEGVLYVSGQIPLNKESGNVVSDTVVNEVHQVMKNIGYILQAADMNFSHVVKCSIFLKDMNHFALVNETYGQYFQNNPPARETVEVSRLPKDVNVEISCIAVK